MATPAQAKQRAVRYAVHTEAASLFKFLTATFSQMPRPVQVVGWFVFLLLFVYLVLSPVVGITYYEGRIMQLSFDPKTGEPSNPSPMSEITVTHDHSVLTNKQGEFTFAGRWPYIPFNPVKFWIDPGVLGEDVSIPTPGPLVSMFNPNRQTIYFVPSSRAKGADGFPQHFFLDSKAANDARDSSRLPNVPQSAPATPAALNLGQRPSLLPVVYAAASNHTERNYTLRLREAKVSGLGREAQVYFDIRIDGQPFRSPNLPDSNSSDSRDLTVLADTPLRFDSLYFPVPEYARRVDISMIERKSFVQRDPLIGTVSLSLDANKTGPYPGLRGGNLELTLELLPPASIRCLAVPGKRKNYIAAVWLDIAEEHLKEVSKLQYDRGSNWDEAVRYVDSSDIYSGLDPFDHYTHLISIFASQPVRTSVDFASGSKITFATFCDVGSNAAGSPMDSYYRSFAYYWTYDFNTALREIDNALKANAALAPPHYLKAAILAKLEKFTEAELEFKLAIGLAPDSQAVLSNYAWLLAEQMTSASRSQLLEALSMAERAVRLLPNPGNYETLGWAEFRLRENDKALQDLLRAKSLCVASCRYSTDWQEIEFHLANVYAFLKQRQEARKAFQAVLQYREESPATSNDKYVRQARTSLGTT